MTGARVTFSSAKYKPVCRMELDSRTSSSSPLNRPLGKEGASDLDAVISCAAAATAASSLYFACTKSSDGGCSFGFGTYCSFTCAVA